MGFRSVMFEHVQLILVGKRRLHVPDLLKEEVAVSDDCVEGAVNGFDIFVGRPDVPVPDTVIRVRVREGGHDQIRLYVRQESQTPAVKGAAFQTGIYTQIMLFGIRKCLHRILFRNGRTRVFLKAGNSRSCNESGNSRNLYDMQYILYHVFSSF